MLFTLADLRLVERDGKGLLEVRLQYCRNKRMRIHQDFHVSVLDVSSIFIIISHCYCEYRSIKFIEIESPRMRNR